MKNVLIVLGLLLPGIEMAYRVRNYVQQVAKMQISKEIKSYD